MATPGHPGSTTIESYSTPTQARATDRPGVLLSHGFTGSTVSMLPWANHLETEGFSVSVPLLPGHGTTWKDLNTTRFEDWYAELAHAFDVLAQQHAQVFVFGLSMGGCLGLKLAAERGSEVAGLVLVNPGLHSNRKDVKLLPFLKHLIPAFPGISNDIKAPGVTEGAYTKTPLRAAHSLFGGMARTCEILDSVHVPVEVYLSREDHVLDTSSAEILRSRIGSRDFTEIELLDSYHVATLDNDAQQIFEGSVSFIERHARSGSR